MSHRIQTYLVIQRPDGQTEHVDVSDKPFAAGLWREGETSRRLLDQIRDATQAAGRGRVTGSYTVDPDDQARRDLDQINRLRNQAHRDHADGHLAEAKAARDQADELERRWRADHPGFARRYDALCNDSAERDLDQDNASDAVRRALQMAD